MILSAAFSMSSRFTQCESGMRAVLSRSRVTWGFWGVATVAGSTGPRCLSLGSPFSMVPLGWLGSYIDVASLPPY